MKDFGEGIRKAISNLSRAAEKCVKEYEKFEKYLNITLSEYEKKIEVKDTTGTPQIDKEKENPYLRMSAYPMEDFGKSDWKILDVNCLPDRFWEEDKYELEFLDLRFPDVAKWENRDIKPTGQIIDYILDGDFKYRYRPTPTKNNHEELAEEYVKGLHTNAFSYPVRSYNHLANMILDNAHRAFIAGRKSMESDS